jgi:3'-5' exoribonuclease
MNTDASPSTRRYRVADLRKGDRIQGGVFLVETSNFKQTRNQKFFIQLVLRDSTGSIRALIWDATADLYQSFQVGDYLRIGGRVEEFQKERQVVVDGFDVEDPRSVDSSDFLPASSRDLDEMERELRQAIGEVRRPLLKQLLLDVVNDPEIRPALRRCPAGKTLHHACLGGLLEHICSLIGAARQIARHYQELDRDILYAACVLHDIGKIRELSFSSSFDYTDTGQLVGHVAIGMLILDRKARQIVGFPDALLLELHHVIASHHGVLEHGALKLPMTAEAMVFHYLDNIDAKLSSIGTAANESRASGESTPNGRWSDFKPHLGRKLYFPHRDEPAEPETSHPTA